MNTLRHAGAGLLFVFSSALAITGCVADSAESGDAPEVTEEAQSAYSEATCGTTSAGVIDDYTACYYSPMYTSASTYGTSACTDAYIVQFHSINNGNGSAWAYWAGPTLNSTTCPTAHVNLKSYDINGTVIAARNATGVWNSSTNRCDFLANGNPAMVTLVADTGGTSRRVVAEAYTATGIYPVTRTFYPVSVQSFADCIH
jgi:hypothetical protein